MIVGDVEARLPVLALGIVLKLKLTLFKLELVDITLAIEGMVLVETTDVARDTSSVVTEVALETVAVVDTTTADVVGTSTVDVCDIVSVVLSVDTVFNPDWALTATRKHKRSRMRRVI